MEKFLVTSLLAFPGFRFLRKFPPQNFEYSADETRQCKRNGLNYNLKIRDYQSWLIYFDCDFDSSFDILKFIKPGMMIIDVGGNIGQTAMMLAKNIIPDGKVISFEPFPQTYNSFKNNLALNPDLDNILIENLGLGEFPSTVKMYAECETNSGGNRVINNSEFHEYTDVPVTTLDIYTTENSLSKIDLIKIDVEGYEMKVLKGAVNILQKIKPALYIEVDDKNLHEQGNSAKELFEFLQSLNYQIFNVSTLLQIHTYHELNSGSRDVYCKVKS